MIEKKAKGPCHWTKAEGKNLELTMGPGNVLVTGTKKSYWTEVKMFVLHVANVGLMDSQLHIGSPEHQ